MTAHVDAARSNDALHLLPVAGREVARLVLDYRLTLQFLDGNDDLDLAIATPFTLVSAGRIDQIDPERPESLGPTLVLLRQVIESATVHEDGGLELAFTRGQRLSLSPDPDYEAWESTSSDGAKLVCLPGGGLAVWEARAT